MAHDGRLDDLAPAEEEDDNLATLTHLDEEIMMSRLFERYSLDKIYTYIGDILVAVNPLKSLPIYGTEFTNRYKKARRSDLPPHIFAMADIAYSTMIDSSRSQCIVISGESGAGKTESAKFVIQQLISLSPVRSAMALEQKIIQVNPLLQAFGNAVTGMNDNSSRFGKYIQLYFRGGQVMGAKISEYLLEKSRVVWQSPREENFHVFYYMLAGLKAEERQRYHLNSDQYRYLVEGIDNVRDQHSTFEKEYRSLLNAMDMVGFTSEEQGNLFLSLATVLNLGNVSIKENAVGCSYVESMDELSYVSELVGIDTDILTSFLTKKETLTAGELITMNLTAEQAADGRNAVAKVLYGRMFGWIVNRVNSLLASQEPIEAKDHTEIGILDIFGFEQFESNHFEQLCINLANEQLQFFFNKHIFTLEQEEYVKEGISWTEITFIDNQPLLEMFFKKITGIFPILDEESFFPKGSDKTFVEKMSEKVTSDFYQKSKQTAEPQFSIKHYAGLVTYSADGFLERNRDTLPPGTLELFQASSNELIQDICMSTITRTGTLALKSLRNKSGKLKKRQERPQRMVAATNRRGLTVSAQFKNSLQLLLEKMGVCEPHFIRCIKPNTEKMTGKFDKEFVLTQLRYTGMLETTRIRKEGYPIRVPFIEFVRRFKCLANLNITSTATGCRRILEAANISGYLIGKQKVFLKYYHMDSLSEQLERVNEAAQVLQKVLRGHTSRRRFATVRASAKNQETEVGGFFRDVAESLLPVEKKLVSLYEQDKNRSQATKAKELIPSPTLPPPPSMDELAADLQKTEQATADDKSESEDDEHEPYGEDIDEVEPVPDKWKDKLRYFGQEGTREASMRWFRETQVQRSAVREADGRVRTWFHGIISRRHAEKCLTNKPVGCFLIRVSESRFGFTLSVRSSTRCKHFMIEQTASGKYVLVGESLAHNSLPELLAYHTKVPVGQERDLLTVPCGQLEGQPPDYGDLIDNLDRVKSRRTNFSHYRGFSSDDVVAAKPSQTPPLQMKSRPRAKTSVAEAVKKPRWSRTELDHTQGLMQSNFVPVESLRPPNSSPDKAGGQFQSNTRELSTHSSAQRRVSHGSAKVSYVNAAVQQQVTAGSSNVGSVEYVNTMQPPVPKGPRPSVSAQKQSGGDATTTEPVEYVNTMQPPVPKGPRPTAKAQQQLSGEATTTELVDYVNTTQPPVPKGPRPLILQDPVYVNTAQPPLPSRSRPAMESHAPLSTSTTSNHPPPPTSLANQRPPIRHTGQAPRISVSSASPTSLQESDMSNLDRGPRKTSAPPALAYPRPPPLHHKGKQRPVSYTPDGTTVPVLISPTDQPLSAPASLTGQQIRRQSAPSEYLEPGGVAVSPFQRPGAPIPPSTDESYLSPQQSATQRIRSWTGASVQPRPRSYPAGPRSAPASISEYLDPSESALNDDAEYIDPNDSIIEEGEYLDPADRSDAFLSNEEYHDPSVNITGSFLSVESADSLPTSIPVYLECISEGRDAEMTSPMRSRQHHPQELTKAEPDAEILRYQLLIKEEEAQLEAIRDEMKTKGLANPNFNLLLERETACEKRLENMQDILARVEASKSSSSQNESGSVVVGRKSPHLARRADFEDVHSSALRHGSTVRKRIEARKRQQQSGKSGHS